MSGPQKLPVKMFDFDALLTSVQMDSFGLSVRFHPQTGEQYDGRGIFEKNHQMVDVETGIHSTTAPVLSIRRSEFLSLSTSLPAQGDLLEIRDGEYKGEVYRVIDSEPETDGETLLVLESYRR